MAQGHFMILENCLMGGGSYGAESVAQKRQITTTIDTLHFGRVSVFKRRSTSASARRPSSIVRRPSSVVPLRQPTYRSLFFLAVFF